MVVVDGKVQTAGALILAQVDDQLSVALMREAYKEAGFWFFPKGHIKAGESQLAAAHREIREELGEVDYVLLTKLGVIERLSTQTSGEIVTKQIHMFLGWCSKPDILTPTDPKIAEATWLPVATAVDLLRYPEDRAAFTTWFAPAL